jgi:orotidine-5'-phosphate decarboxylase
VGSTGVAPSFVARFFDIRPQRGPLVLGLDPSAALLGDWGLSDDADGLERFVDIAVTAAAEAVGVAKPQSAFYERHGWRGIKALTRLVEELRSAGVLVILDVKRGDIGSTNQAYAEAYLGHNAPLRADAVTLTAYLGLAAMEEYFHRARESGAALFIVTRSSNPEGRELQTAVTAGGLTVEQSIVADLGRLNRELDPEAVGPFGAVFGPTHAPPPDIDLAGMNGLYLAPGLGAQGATAQDVARCFAACPERVLASASRSVLAAGPEPAALADSARTLSAALAAALTPGVQIPG